MERAIVSAGGAESSDYLGNSSVLGPVRCWMLSAPRARMVGIRPRAGCVLDVEAATMSSGLAWRIILTGDGIISKTVCPPDVIARGGAI